MFYENDYDEDDDDNIDRLLTGAGTPRIRLRPAKSKAYFPALECRPKICANFPPTRRDPRRGTCPESVTKGWTKWQLDSAKKGSNISNKNVANVEIKTPVLPRARSKSSKLSNTSNTRTKRSRNTALPAVCINPKEMVNNIISQVKRNLPRNPTRAKVSQTVNKIVTEELTPNRVSFKPAQTLRRSNRARKIQTG